MGSGLGGGGLAGYVPTVGTNLSLSGNLVVTGTITGGASGFVVSANGLITTTGAYTAGGLTAGAPAIFGSYNGSTTVGLWGVAAPSASNFILIGGTGATTLNSNGGQNLSFATNGTTVAGVVATFGTFQTGATTIPDASGTPGNATQNSPRGRAAIANLAASVTITNSQCTLNSVVCVTWEASPQQLWSVAVNAGSFVVTLAAAAASDVNFRYVIFQ